MEASARGVFVGRERELGELGRAMDAARAGSGTAVLVAGEAGIGKTRLASELAARARDAGFEVLLGRSIDLVGTELPYQPFVEAVGPLGGLPQVDGEAAGSQLRVFQDTTALLGERTAAAPVLLVLEDLHWADASTLDLVIFLAHNLRDRRVLLLATYRADELASAERMRRLADGVRRSGSALAVELGPLQPGELAALLAARAATLPPAALTEAIVARSEGNPFFAEELLAAAGDQGGELPRGLRALLLGRVARLDPATQGLLRLAAAAGRDVGYPLLRAVAALPEGDVRESLRRAVEYGVLVVEQMTGSFCFRHALLAEAVYATILPGEREELHARLAEELARAAAAPAELAPHWAAAGRGPEALAASVQAARQAEAVFGLAEALAHLERALALWPAVPEASELVGLDLAELCSWTAELADQTGAAPRAVELGQRAIELAGEGDRLRAALLHERLGRYLHASGRTHAGLAAFQRAVELVPAQPPSSARAQALAALGTGLHLAWRFDESLSVCEEALALARTVGAHSAELRALTDLGSDLAYLGRGDEGLARLRQALRLAEGSGDPLALQRAYVYLAVALTMLGRPRESARLAETGRKVLRRYGVDNAVLAANYEIEALLATGDWDEADHASAAALRAITASYPYMLLMLRADLELGRGRFEAARAHLEAALVTLREDRGQGIYDVFLAELALWERRWIDAEGAVRDALAGATVRPGRPAPRLVLRQGAARPGGAGGAGPWPPRCRRRPHLAGPGRGAHRRRSRRGHRGGGGHAQRRRLARPGRGRAPSCPRRRPAGAVGRRRGRLGAARAPAAGGLLPLARGRGARGRRRLRAQASQPLRQAYAVAAQIGAKPLAEQLELLTQRARLELVSPDAGPPDRTQGLEELLDLTPREAEVLTLIARGYTNREIAAALVISVRTAGVHVSHILRKLGAPNRLEAAAIAHRLAPPHVGQPELPA